KQKWSCFLVFFVIGKCFRKAVQILKDHIQNIQNDHCNCKQHSIAVLPQSSQTQIKSRKPQNTGMSTQNVHSLSISFPLPTFLSICRLKRQCKKKRIDQKAQKKNSSCNPYKIRRRGQKSLPV